MYKAKISVIILVKNAEDKIKKCLESVINVASEIIILDTGSTDNTINIAKRFKVKVMLAKGKDYATWRNEASEHASSDWLLYIDHDERISDKLANEIKLATHNGEGYSSFDIPRKNYVFGKWLKYGGWWPDRVLRLIKKDKLVSWQGEVHEQPKIKGELGHLSNALVHLKEDNLSDMVEKTNRYSVYEAKLLFDAKHPPMVWWRFFSIISRELNYRFINKLGFLDGPQGIIYCLYQGYSRFITYSKLWELQINKVGNK